MTPKYYKIQVNENDETGVDFNSFVDVPAHMRGFISFNSTIDRYKFNEEERTVTGCMIAVDMPIRRVSKDLGEHYVIFDTETVKIINRKFSKNNFGNNVNTMHDMEKATKGAIQTSRFIASNSNDKLPNIPQIFENQKIKDGSLFCTYYVEDEQLWQDVKSGKFQGFSVEGWFDRKEVIVKTNKTDKMSKPNFWDKAKSLFSIEDAPTDTPAEITFSEATTADGIVVFYEGELAEGVALTIEADGTKIPAPEGDHELTLADATVKVVTLDATGTVTAMADVQEMGTDEPTEDGQTVFMKEFVTATEARFKALETENTNLKNELENLSKGGKFNKQSKTTGEEKKTSWRTLSKN